MKITNKKIIAISVVVLALMVIGISYAYFSAQITGSESSTTLNVTGGSISLTVNGGNDINVQGIIPGNNSVATKTITITSNDTTELSVPYTLDMVVVSNTFSDNAITYTLTSTNNDNNGAVIPGVSEKTGIASGQSNINFGNGYFTPGSGMEHTYVFNLYFLDTDTDQNEDQGKEIQAYFTITSAKAVTEEQLLSMNVEFEPNGDTTYSQSKTVTVSASNSLDNISSIKYLWSSLTSVSDEELFTQTVDNGGSITSPEVTGDYYLYTLVTDAENNTEIHQSNVYKVDNQNPTITLNGNDPMTVYLGKTYTEPGATATDVQDGDLTNSIEISGSVNTNTVGTYTITYTVSDSSGNSTTETRTVNVMVNQTPTITLIGANPITLYKGQTYSEPGATATDTEDGSITSSIVVSGTVNTNTVGSYTVTYTVTDSYGNTTSKTRTVNVILNQSPVITLNGSSPMSVYQGKTYTEPGATATDNEDGTLTSSITTSGSVNTSSIGSYTITYSVTDSYGNTTTKTRTVNVIAIPYLTSVILGTSNANVTSTLTTPGRAVSTSGEAVLASTTDDYGTTYYYRGAITNNYILFANMCWRIVRITGNSAIKLVLYNYNPNSVANPCDTSQDGASYAFARYTGTTYTSYFNPTGSYSNGGIGLMYGSTYPSTTYANAHANQIKSTILTNLETWYTSKLSSYASYLADVIWCNDKSITSGTGIYTTNTVYAGYTRLFNTSTAAPTLVCPNDANGGKLSKFTVSDTTYGNGALTYKIGLMTADEVAYAGSAYWSANSTYYLYKNSTAQNWWTSTPYQYYFPSNLLIDVTSNYGYNYGADNNALGLRPAIALVSSTKVTGTGTSSDPYIVQ